jgi:hypothetical protein
VAVGRGESCGGGLSQPSNSLNKPSPRNSSAVAVVPTQNLRLLLGEVERQSAFAQKPQSSLTKHPPQE